MTENQSDSEYFQHLEPIIDNAYSLYMPQVRSEITEFYRFLNQHYGLTKKSEPYNVLEIGTKFGGTFFLWCSMNRSTGLNISIDMNDGGKHGGIGTEKMDERDGWFQERFDNCKFIRGNSHEQNIQNQLSILLNSHMIRLDTNGLQFRELDFLFIDGDHTYEGVKQDFLDYEPFVKKGGLICFHDIKDTQRHRERDVWVANFWNEIQDKYTHYEFCDKSFDWGGIGCLIQL